LVAVSYSSLKLVSPGGWCILVGTHLVCLSVLFQSVLGSFCPVCHPVSVLLSCTLFSLPLQVGQSTTQFTLLVAACQEGGE
jgi:hypothetical protein